MNYKLTTSDYNSLVLIHDKEEKGSAVIQGISLRCKQLKVSVVRLSLQVN